MDDIVITSCDLELVEHFIKILSERFSLKDLDNLTYFLGIEASWSNKGLLLTQTKHITDLLAKTHMLTSNPVVTPMATNVNMTL